MHAQCTHSRWPLGLRESGPEDTRQCGVGSRPCGPTCSTSRLSVGPLSRPEPRGCQITSGGGKQRLGKTQRSLFERAWARLAAFVFPWVGSCCASLAAPSNKHDKQKHSQDTLGDTAAWRPRVGCSCRVPATWGTHGPAVAVLQQSRKLLFQSKHSNHHFQSGRQAEPHTHTHTQQGVAVGTVLAQHAQQGICLRVHSLSTQSRGHRGSLSTSHMTDRG